MRLSVRGSVFCSPFSNIWSAKLLFVETTQSEIVHQDDQIKVLKDEKTFQELSQIQKAAEVRDARRDYEIICQLHREREEKLSKYSDRKILNSWFCPQIWLS